VLGNLLIALQNSHNFEVGVSICLQFVISGFMLGAGNSGVFGIANWLSDSLSDVSLRIVDHWTVIHATDLVSVFMPSGKVLTGIAANNVAFAAVIGLLNFVVKYLTVDSLLRRNLDLLFIGICREGPYGAVVLNMRLITGIGNSVRIGVFADNLSRDVINSCIFLLSDNRLRLDDALMSDIIFSVGLNDRLVIVNYIDVGSMSLAICIVSAIIIY